MLTVMNESETSTLGAVTVKRSTPTLRFKMPAGTKDVHFYISSNNNTTGSLPAHNFYIDDLSVSYIGTVTVQEPVDNYRFGFNGKEKENEVKGTGNQIDYGMRTYDPRLGKFFSVDPLTKSYPMLTPYQFASNRPIDGIDLDGAEYHPSQDLIIQMALGVTKIKTQMQAGVNNIIQSQTATGTSYDHVVPKNVQKIHKQQQLAKGIAQVAKATSEAGHIVFDAAGSAPVIGEAFDLANALWYSAEGNYKSAAISSISILPVIGDMFKISKYTVKETSFIGEIIDPLGSNQIFEATFKNIKTGIEIGFMAEKSIINNGQTLVLSDVVIGAKGAKGNELKNEVGEMILKYKSSLVEFAREMGFETLEITGTRVVNSSSIKPGKEVKITINLTK